MSENNQNNLSNEQIEYARVIQSSGHGLLSLIDEILDLSKIEAGKMELQYADVAVQDIAQDMTALFDPIAREKGIIFKTAIDKEVQGIIETDRLRLEQIIKNLVANALKFTSKGYVELKISTAGPESHTLIFTVKDTGIGISPDKQAIIFEAFQQADGSTRRKYGVRAWDYPSAGSWPNYWAVKYASIVNQGKEVSLLYGCPYPKPWPRLPVAWK